MSDRLMVYGQSGTLAARALALAAASLIVASCGGDSPRTAATGATVTRNGDTTIVVPALRPDSEAGRLIPELVIGDDESNPDAIFGSIGDVAQSPDGRMHVLDTQGENRVSTFDAQGRFLGLLTRHGEGPGEIENARFLAVAPDGRVAVASSMEIEMFGADGEALESFRPGGATIQHPFRFDASGLLRVHTGSVAIGPRGPVWSISHGGPRFIEVVTASRITSNAVRLFDSTGAVRDSAAAPFGLEDMLCIMAGPPGSEGRICLGFTYSTFPWFDWRPDGTLLSGHTAEYRIDLTSPGDEEDATDATEVLSIRPPRAALKVEGGLRDAMEAGAMDLSGTLMEEAGATPARKPALARVIPAADGRIWVQLHAESGPTMVDGEERWQETDSRFDIFTPRGEHVGLVTGPSRIHIHEVRADTVLAVVNDDYGVDTLVRFTIDWTSPPP